MEPTFHYLVHKSPLLAHKLVRINPFHTHKFYAHPGHCYPRVRVYISSRFGHPYQTVNYWNLPCLSNVSACKCNDVLKVLDDVLT
jgi:hypothetical protein